MDVQGFHPEKAKLPMYSLKQGMFYRSTGKKNTQIEAKVLASRWADQKRGKHPLYIRQLKNLTPGIPKTMMCSGFP